MKYAIFGGTFDPFTKAHKAIVNAILDKKLVNEVFIAPTITNWYRDKNDVWLTDKQRVDLCYAAQEWISLCRDKRHDEIKDYSIIGRCYVWARDINKKNALPAGQLRDEFVKSWHFIDTLIDFRTEYLLHNDDELYVVIGSDQLKFFKQWHRWEDILRLAKLIVINGRNGEHVESDVPHIDLELPVEFQDVSATDIRNEYRNIENGFNKYLKLFIEPPKETVLEHTPIFDLVQKPDPDGKIGFNPVGINSPDWACVIVEKDGKFLMVDQLRYGLMERFSEFPCGMVEKNENPIYAAKRELLEETGIHLLNGVSYLRYLGKFAANPAFMNNYMHYFYVSLNSAKWEQERQRLDEHEKLTVCWKSVKDVVQNWFDGQSVFFGGALTKMMQYGIITANDMA